MKTAVILAGGKGTRLRPYTVAMPKPLVPVADKPILEIIIIQLVRQGFQKVIVTVNHQADIIMAYFGNGIKWGIEIEYSLEDKPLGTMGPLKILKDLPEHFLVMNGDVLADLEYSAFLEEHICTGKMFSIASYRRTQKNDYGILETRNSVLTGFQEKPEYQFIVSMGIYAVSRKTVEYIPADEYYGFDMLMKQFLEKDIEVSIHEHKGYWMDIGRPEDYLQAVEDLETGGIQILDLFGEDLMMYKIPLFDLNFGEEEEEAVVRTLKSKWISMGPKCTELEKKFAELLGVKYACAVTNCTAALHLACCALGIGQGDEVICPSLTFAATVNCIRYVGAAPVFADIYGIDNLCMDAGRLENLITKKTKAIIPMHYAGFPCDMRKVMELAKKYSLYVIEDACHGPLSEYKGKKLGTVGDIGCFSFFSNKNISTGEGGMIVTNNEKLYNKIKLMRSHGMTTMSYQRASGHAVNYDIVDVGYNYRMDDIRASIGIVQLDKLEDDLKKRASIRKWYLEYLSDISHINVPFKKNEDFVSNYIFPIVLKDSTEKNRNRVRVKLHEQGIQTSVHYPAAHRFSVYRKYGRNLPNTEYVSDNEITLPMYAKLEREEIVAICKSLSSCLEDR